MKFSKRIIKNKLVMFGFDQTTSTYIAEAVMYCIHKKIHILDLNLAQQIYPFIAEKYDTTPSVVEHELIMSLKEFWKNNDNKRIIKDIFGYTKKPTVKKLIILILINKEKIEEE